MANITMVTRPTKPNGSQNSYEPANVRLALAEKMIFSEAIEKVGEMLKSYPPSELDHSGYIGALASCLMQYPKCVAIRCAAISGVVSATKFKPTIADITAWCERELAGLRTIVEREDQEQKWARERNEAAQRERTRIAKFKNPGDVERVKMKLAETLESLGKAIGNRSEVEARRKAEQALERCLREANAGLKIKTSPQLAAILRQREVAE
jgi:hypothetical protein